MKEFLKDLNLELKDNIVQQGKKFYLVSEELDEAKKSINRNPDYQGIFLGEKKKSFYPSPTLIDLLSKKAKNKVTITKKAEWMFLCGKDVFAENARGKDSGTVFIQSEDDENLGYGYWTKKKGRKIIKNLLDKGNYLRKEN